LPHVKKPELHDQQERLQDRQQSLPATKLTAMTRRKGEITRACCFALRSNPAWRCRNQAADIVQ
jgi:hypothetical protein